MARGTRRRTVKEVAALREPGRYSDGNGLYLHVKASGARSWVFVFQWCGKRAEIGLGSAADGGGVSLAEARALAEAARKDLRAGVKPTNPSRKTDPTLPPTFREFADALGQELKPGWKAKTQHQRWDLAIHHYGKPLHRLRLDEIGTEHVLSVLRPIWTTKPETAQKTRGYIERVLDAGKARGLRSGENPAAWRGHLQLLLSKPRKLTRGHHAAVPVDEMPELFAELWGSSAVSARLLCFVILTCVRATEARGALWSEFDLEKRLWTIPGGFTGRMKGRDGTPDHVVPLSRPAMAVLRSVGGLDARLAFPGQREDRMLSLTALEKALTHRRPGFTVHGLRSTFRDWVSERTDFSDRLAEHALAHVLRSETERAYRRGTAIEKRRVLMDAWAEFVTSRIPA